MVGDDLGLLLRMARNGREFGQRQIGQFQQNHGWKMGKSKCVYLASIWKERVRYDPATRSWLEMAKYKSAAPTEPFGP